MGGINPDEDTKTSSVSLQSSRYHLTVTQILQQQCQRKLD